MSIIKPKIVIKKEEEKHSWPKSYTKAVNQGSVQKETTMLKLGTLSRYLYNVTLLELAEKSPVYGQSTAEKNVKKKHNNEKYLVQYIK